MAQLFRERVAAAEAALRAVEENKSILFTSENIK
jgi:hypothetical protein